MVSVCPVLRVCCCGPRGQAISIDCCTARLQQARSPSDPYPQQHGGQQQMRAVSYLRRRRKLNSEHGVVQLNFASVQNGPDGEIDNTIICIEDNVTVLEQCSRVINVVYVYRKQNRRKNRTESADTKRNCSSGRNRNYYPCDICRCPERSVFSVCLTESVATETVNTLLPIAKRSIVMSVSVCLCVFACSRAYLQNYTSDLHKIFCACYTVPIAVARSSSGSVVLCYVHPSGLWMTSYLLRSQGCSTSPHSWSAVHTQPWAWL